MSKAPNQVREPATQQSLADFVRSLPADAPTEVTAALDLFVREDGPGLGPQLFFELVEQAPIAVSITDAKADILYVNRAFETLTGYSAKDIIGRNESALSDKATPVGVYRVLWKTIQSKRTWRGTLVNRRRNGDTYLAEVSISPVLERDGAISHFLGMHRDVTEVHRLSGEVAHQKRLIESVLDHAPVCVALIDGDQRVILDNQEYKKLLGDLHGQEPARLLCEAITEQAGVDLPDCKTKGEGFADIEVRLDVSGSRGPRWFSVSGTWIGELDTNAAGFFRPGPETESCLLLLAHETTRQRRDSERCRIAHLRATVAEQQRAGGMREALAAASFQIQQPLNLVNAAITMLQRSGGANQSLLPVLTRISESAEQAYQALKSALPDESLDELPQSVNLNEIVQDVLQLNTDQLLAASVVVSWTPQPVLPAVTGYPRALRGLFMNLLDNALQALKEGNGVQPEIRVSTMSDDQVVAVELCDNGVGLPANALLTVFEPLHCGWHNKRGHAGMGLSMVRDIAGRHGGEVSMEPASANGCRVMVTIPLKDVD